MPGSLRQLWEVDLHPEEACSGPIDLHLSLDVDPRAMLGFEDEVMKLDDIDDTPPPGFAFPLVFTWTLPPLPDPPDLLVTNYSMLNAMLMRDLEDPLFAATEHWLSADSSNVFTLFSEAWNKTLKYAPVFPESFSSLQAARQFMSDFVDHYNHHHRHGGIGLHTPADVHYGLAGETARQRTLTLEAARRRGGSQAGHAARGGRGEPGLAARPRRAGGPVPRGPLRLRRRAGRGE